MSPRTPLLSAKWRSVAPVVCLLLSLWPLLARAEEPPASPGLSAEAQAIAQDINVRRAQAGLAPLTLHPLLNQAAQNHVNDIVYNGAYGHMGSDGSYVRQRVQRVGYASGGFASENWVSATGPGDAMTWWMNDWIHRVNILNPRWQDMGVGAATGASGRMIFVTVFTAGNGAGDDNGMILASANQVQAAPSSSIEYRIQPGDTLIGIAVRYGVDWTMIAEENRLRDDTLLQIGQTIRVPGVRNIGGPVVEPAGVVNAVQSSTPSDQFINAAGGGAAAYAVRSGDTLLGIAIQHGLTWEALAAANGLGERDLLQIGQQLTIPGATAQPAGFVQASASVPVVQPVYYTIQPGDTILSVAINNGLDWHGLLALNGLGESTLLQIGQQIRLR